MRKYMLVICARSRRSQEHCYPADGRLYVCFQHNISKTDATRITKLDVWWVLEPHLFWIQKVEGQGHESQITVPAWVIALLWVIASSTLCLKNTPVIF